MAHATRLPEIEIRDGGIGFALRGPPEALIQLAEAFSGDVLSIEVTPDDGSVIVVRLADDGPVIMRHEGLKSRHRRRTRSA
jgi:hypothetical protein